MVHLYHGKGKGKTTAAMGLALRVIGHGGKVVIVQFLKDGKSGELAPLKSLGAEVFSGKEGTKFFAGMNEAERAETRRINDENLRRALEIECDLLVLDEACAAVRLGMVDRKLLRAYVESGDFEESGTMNGIDKACYDESETGAAKPKARFGKTEIVLTGRDPERWMLDAADYITEMRCDRHPFERGVGARAGVEY